MGSTTSQILRKDACNINSTLNSTRALPTFNLPDAIPNFNGLLPVSALVKDLEITLPWWSGSQSRMRLQVAWKAFVSESPENPGSEDLVGDYHTVTADEAAAPETVFKLSVPVAKLTHGTYLARVRAQSIPGGVIDWSVSQPVLVDTEAPGGGALPRLEFPPTVVASGMIVDSDIVGGFLPVQLAHYEGIARGDTIQLYINTTPCGSEELTVDPDPIAGFIRLNYKESDLEGVGNGIKTFHYKVTDKAGNFAGAVGENFDVQLHTTPKLIPAPTVPQADPDILDEAEARSGTRVGITKYDLAQAGDEIMVHWGSLTSPKFPLQAGDLGDDPFITINLPYSLVAAEVIKGDVEVTFEVFRNGNSIGTSEINTVTVDLTLPGGPDPDPETPINENLLPLTVRSASGGEDNVIPPEDFDANATAIIPWLAADGDDIYELDDLVELTWGSQTALKVTRTIVQLDIDAAVDLRLTVPSTTIQAEGSGTDIVVQYTITRATSTSPYRNTAIAPTTEVDVTGPDVLPGKGIIDAPVFTLLNEFDAVGQNELIGPPGSRYNPVQSRVVYENVAVGDTVQLFLSG